LAEASSELANRGDEAKLYAGGVELLLLLRGGMVETDYLINVKTIPGLNELAWDGGTLHIGTTVTHWRIANDVQTREHSPTLTAACAHLGNVRIRIQGTLGGNLCFADPHADPGTALLIHEATVSLAGATSVRSLSLEDFFLGSYQTALEPDELLSEITVPALPSDWRSSYARLEQFQRPTLNVATGVLLSDGQIAEARLAVGCVGPKPVRLRDLEDRVKGTDVSGAERIIDESRSYLRDVLDPIDDLLGSADYKVHVAGMYLKRALAEAVA
jgi:carbon-monoxide dehydrogenase medium subunit